MTTTKRDPDSLFVSVHATCSRLQEAYLSPGDNPAKHQARATLAELRKIGSADLSKNPLGLETILFTLTPPLDEGSLGKGDRTSPSEAAAATTLALFAIHMQSAKKPAHVEKTSFARACGQLIARTQSQSIKPRIDAMLVATNEHARMRHLRSLITLLRGQELGFDYARLALDLRSLSHSERRTGVLQRWGRDIAAGFHHTAATPEIETTE
ncbi:MAG: type I-E CRISPR-associated protein Cse2/CasB [Corynebacterium sp.]|nr:type I-E CRISPR-associated protein Cse2/CasB [Corynebacterium sp.]